KTAVNANSLTVIITGTSRAALSGIAANAKFTITGAATTDAPNLAADTLAVHLAGAGKMNIHINRHLNVHASGASLIEYTGAPTAEINTSGAAQVRRRELGSRK
ncbi:MAG: DUF2807 domain-containing protein, partial [Prevotellaceae bacterium]|nr:DUF2807 domain-containing protein [Prevotellaceae bacterium]